MSTDLHDLYPLLLEPRLHRRVWGGDRLPALHAGRPPRHGPEGEPVGESWLAGDDNVILNGALAGRTLGEVAADLGAALVGSVAYARYGARLPLLAKFLDAAADLSVQVHPDDAYALCEEAASGHLGKSEAWYVLEAEPGASVLWGFRRDVSQDEVLRAAEDGTLPELMNRVPVRPGDVVVNAAGMVHAVGAGVRLFEIQQASDLTYRLFDYGRLGADGQPRTLHLERGLAVADLSGVEWAPGTAHALDGGWQRIVQRPEFVLDRVELIDAELGEVDRGDVELGNVQPGDVELGDVELGDAGATGRLEPTSFQVLTVTRGRATLSPRQEAAGGGAAGWEPVELAAGSTVVLPAALGSSYVLKGAAEVLRSAVAAVEH